MAKNMMNFVDPEVNVLLKDRYKLYALLGKGSFGKVYKCWDVVDEMNVAVKVEMADVKVPRLIHEGNIYKALQGQKGIPTMHWFGKDGLYNLLVVELLGDSIQDLFIQYKKKFSMKTVLMLGDQIVGRVKICHKMNIIHRDIKPANLVMGMGRLSSVVYLVDFGLSKWYIDYFTYKHIAFRENKGLTGTPHFASINGHRGYELSQRDDLESVIYCMMYLLNVNLPWEHVKSNNEKQEYEMIFEKKLATPVSEICKTLPIEFTICLQYCRDLQFSDNPDHSHLRRIFRKMIRDMNLRYDFRYDWMLQETPSHASKTLITIIA